MINKFFKYSLMAAIALSFNSVNAQEITPAAEAAASKAKEKVDAHKGHAHKKIDKNDPKYKEYLKQRVEAQEKRDKEISDFDKSEDFNVGLLTEDLKHDVNIGDVNAPIKIVEYASLSCGHCRSFHENVYYPLKKNLIDTGKAYFKYRHYPLNGSAVKGALLVSCAEEGNKQAILGGLFKGQGQWAYAKNEAQLIDRLQTAALIAGLDKKEFQSCYDNESAQDEILTQMKRANKELKVESTPSIFINGARYTGARDYDSIKAHIDGILIAKSQSKPKSE